MKNATAKNDIQVIQKVLEEYLGKRKAAKVAVEISAEISTAMQEETQHTHMEEIFYIHKDEGGAIVPTRESMVKSNVEAILNYYLEKDEVQECFKLLIGEQLLGETKATTETAEFEPTSSRKIVGKGKQDLIEYLEDQIQKHEELSDAGIHLVDDAEHAAMVVAYRDILNKIK